MIGQSNEIRVKLMDGNYVNSWLVSNPHVLIVDIKFSSVIEPIENNELEIRDRVLLIYKVLSP